MRRGLLQVQQPSVLPYNHAQQRKRTAGPSCSCSQCPASIDHSVCYLFLSRQEFSHWLLVTFPEKEDLIYQKSSQMEGTSIEEASNSSFVVHVANLGYTQECSIKPPCGRELFKGLRDQILQDGFVTATESLFVARRLVASNERLQIFGDEASIPAFSLCYSKGLIFSRDRTDSTPQ